MLIGKVTASAIGRSSPGFDLGAEIFIAAGTAIYEALAARVANMNLFATSLVMGALTKATMLPFTSGINIENKIGNQPKEKKAFSFLPLVIPMSKRKIARNPFKMDE